MKLTLHRLNINANATYGILKLPNISELLTLEHNDLKIPEGEYICKRVNSPKFGNTFEVTNVKNRTHILFHAGNAPSDTQGCILLGTMFNGDSIKNSKLAFNRFLEAVESVDEFRLAVDLI